MPKSSRAWRAARSAGLLVALAAGAAAPATASAASAFTCEASAVRAGVLTAPPIEPVVANRGQADCKAVKAGVPAIEGLPVPTTARLISAQTSRSGSDAEPGSQKAGAFGAIADLSVGLPPLPIKLPVDQIPSQLNLTVPVSQLPALPLPPGVPVPTQDIQVPIADQLRALAPNGVLPTELIGLRGGAAFASAGCVDGAAQLNGFSQVAGLRVLGQEVPTDKAVTQALTVIGGGSIDPSKINVAELVSQTPALKPLGEAVQPTVQQALDALPDIPIPAQLAQLQITPAEQVREGDKLTQRALRVRLAIAGQSIADVAVGEASVSAKDVVCTAPRQAVAEEQLSCTRRRLVLVDVLRRGNRVYLFGVADRKLAGKQVALRFTGPRARIVARPTIRRDGSYSATAPLPPRAIRATNLSRYQASIGREKSLELKLARRMVFSSLSSRDGQVTLRGRVIRPLGRPVQAIVVQRRVSCRRFEVVKRIKPSRTGAFRVTVDAPPESLAATYRLSTRVRKFARNPKLYPTFTLPRTVEIR